MSLVLLRGQWIFGWRISRDAQTNAGHVLIASDVTFETVQPTVHAAYLFLMFGTQREFEQWTTLRFLDVES
jgi:hypothetical protein